MSRHFRRDALDEIFACARLPTAYHILCDNALLFGCSTNTYHIGRDIIRHVAKDMDISTLEDGVTPESGLLTRLLPALPRSVRDVSRCPSDPAACRSVPV